MATLVLVGDRCTYFGLLVGTLPHPDAAVEDAFELAL